MKILLQVFLCKLIDSVLAVQLPMQKVAVYLYDIEEICKNNIREK
jgi:hypothetical protein